MRERYAHERDFENGATKSNRSDVVVSCVPVAAARLAASVRAMVSTWPRECATRFLCGLMPAPPRHPSLKTSFKALKLPSLSISREPSMRERAKHERGGASMRESF